MTHTCEKETHWYRPHMWNGYTEIAVDSEKYVIPCPHCSPSYLLFKPKFTLMEICYNAGSDLCNKCYEPECELSRTHGVQSSTLGVIE